MSASGSAESEETISASSCSWKTTTQSGECFLEPRTCSECLDETPTTGETCVLTDTGICLSVEEYQETLASDGDTFYLAENATYCADKLSNSSSESTEERCVVVESCESSTWLSYARQRLPLVVLAVGGSTPEGCSFVAATANAGSESTTDASSPSSSSMWVSSSSKDTLASQDKCTWYQNTTLCSTPRTCYDCLNTLSDNGGACTITPGGYCATLSTTYKYTLDFRNPGSTSDGYYYPSTNATYCEVDDQACTDCNIAGSSSNSASYCIGSGGCVCVAFCQSTEWQATVVSEKCEVASASTLNRYGTEFPWKTFCIFLSLAVAVILAVLLGIWRVRQVIRARRRESMRSRPTETRRSTLSLELPAWKALREELIDNKVDPVGEGRGRLRPML
ncbi:hypothetical protein PRIC2_014486 [Phytophthora ramorum]